MWRFAMRAYFFGNGVYMSQIQQGIQAAHALARMFVDPDMDESRRAYLHAWANDHETIILLNGGMSAQIQEILYFFTSPQNPYPWAPFYEEPAALTPHIESGLGALTTVGIIIPEKIYGLSSLIKQYPDTEQAIEGKFKLESKDGDFVDHEVSNWEFSLAKLLNSYRLA